jgi:hypothetical protein
MNSEIDWPARSSGMPFRLDQAVQVLRRTPAVANELLGSGLSEPWLMNNYGPETFAPFDVVGHLIHGERTDWMVRLRIILEFGPGVPFERYDRYAQFEASRNKSMAHLLAEFAELREANLKELVGLNLTTKQLDLEGTHPVLGRVTLKNLLATWVCHDLNHIHQIAKAMAYQYRREVGAWTQFLTILPQKQ